MTRRMPLLGDDHLGGFDDSHHLVAGLEVQLLGRDPRDGGYQSLPAHVHHHFSHDCPQLHLADCALQLIASAELQGELLSGKDGFEMCDALSYHVARLALSAMTDLKAFPDSDRYSYGQSSGAVI
jgi:hypothetical protein